MRVDHICTRKAESVSPEQTVAVASRRMRDSGLGSLVVVDSLERPLGIVTDRDLAIRCVAEDGDPRNIPVGRVMSGPAAWTRPETPVAEALAEMTRLRVRRLPVVDERDRLVGILSLDDVLAAEHPEETPLGRALRETL